jgi:DNA-binding LytR/AlgR family response regulator
MNMNPASHVRVLVAEDDAPLRRNIIDLIHHLRPDWQVVAEAASVAQVMTGVDDSAPDLMILDIHLDGGASGEWLERLPPEVPVIFATGDPNFAVNAFDRAAIDYLLKPITLRRLRVAIERAEQHVGRRSLALPVADEAEGATAASLAWITMSRGNDVLVVAESDVVYLQADLKYTRVVSTRGDGLVRLGINELSARLSRGNFAKIHRSVVVNRSFISAIRRNDLGQLSVHLTGRAEVLKVSKTFQSVFKTL